MKRSVPEPDPGSDRRAPRERGVRLPVDPSLAQAAMEAGVDLSGEGRAGTYLQVDRAVLCRDVGQAEKDKIEVLPLAEALDRYGWLKGYLWKSVAAGADPYTARAARSGGEGYFVRIRAGARVALPVQTCLAMARSGTAQIVHNIIVAEEGSEAHLITGCTVHPDAGTGLHLGISEFYVGPGASLTFTMIHNWSEGFHVRPRSAATVEAGGTFVSNFVITRPVGSLQMCPVTVLRGEGARGRFQAILCGRGSSTLDIGSRTVLEGRGARSESISRAIAGDESSIVARGTLTARTDLCRAHLECRGLITSAEAFMQAVPQLEAEGVPRAELSHEAAISPIAEEEIAYLMSRGLSRDEALSTIVRGFLNVELLGLPGALQRRIEDLIAATRQGT